MGCVLSSDWCGEEEVQPVPVVRNSSLKRRSVERSDSSRMRLTKVSVHAVYARVCNQFINKHGHRDLACRCC